MADHPCLTAVLGGGRGEATEWGDTRRIAQIISAAREKEPCSSHLEPVTSLVSRSADCLLADRTLAPVQLGTPAPVQLGGRSDIQLNGPDAASNPHGRPSRDVAGSLRRSTHARATSPPSLASGGSGLKGGNSS